MKKPAITPASRGRGQGKRREPRPVPIVALDVPTLREAAALVRQLGGVIRHYKIGMQLFTAEGPRAVEAVLKAGGKVFLDLKLHDIPNTVAKSVEAAGKLGVHSVSLHLSGGRAMCEAAAAVSPRPLLWGVTVLTSLDLGDMLALGGGTPKERALALAERYGNLMDGIVASGKEALVLRSKLGFQRPLIVPGIRPHGNLRGDQRRVIAPEEAVRLGIDYVVVGRPILEAPDRAKAAAELVRSLADGRGA